MLNHSAETAETTTQTHCYTSTPLRCDVFAVLQCEATVQTVRVRFAPRSSFQVLNVTGGILVFLFSGAVQAISIVS